MRGYESNGCARWRDLLSRGESVHGRVRDLPASERHVPEEKGMKSIALMPIFAGDIWWGFLALGQVDSERDWSSVELEALKAAAEVFGAAIERTSAEAERTRMETRLRDRKNLKAWECWRAGSRMTSTIS